MNKKLLNRLGHIYIYMIGISILSLLYFFLDSIVTANIPEILFWIALAVIADIKPIRILSNVNLDMTMSFAVHLSAAIILGTGSAVWIVVIATLFVEILSRKPLQRVIFNAGQYGLTLFITGLTFHTLKLSPQNIPIDIIADMPAIFISVGVYYFFNTFFVSSVISLTRGNKFLDVFLNDCKINMRFSYSLAPISITAALLYTHDQPYIILLMIPPLLMADQALRKYYSLHREAQETLKVLATTLDKRDKYTFSHSVNVAEYSKKIAEQLGLTQVEINDIEMAGNIHDLGKVGIEDELLNKKGKLTDEEYNIVKKHPYTGYGLLKNLKPYKKCAEYVLYHHERIDGNGYPGKIAGNNIPLGARILSVADSYDAMTTDRPYREALSQTAAVNEMKAFTGTQFDPAIVEAFITILKRDYGYIEEEK